MRTITYLLVCFLSISWLFAQNPVGPDLNQYRVDAEPSNTAPNALRQAPGSGVIAPPPSYAGNPCPTIDNNGTASNIFSIILTECNPIAVDNDLNTMVFIHRNNATQFGGHSGQLRMDYSTNGGTTWTLNSGVINSASINGTNAARYPSAAIYNPPNNTSPANAYMVYQAPTVNTTWNGYVSGVTRLNLTGTTENYNQPAVTNTLIPRSMAKAGPGKYFSVDAVWSGTAVTGYRVLEGTWNGTTDVVWTQNTTFTPPFNILYDGNAYTSDFNIAFDPSGQNGWVCVLTHITGAATNYAFYPVFYHTTDGGTTWSGPEQVDVGQLSCVSPNITANNVASTAFDMDLTVDMNGNPHCAVTVCNGNNTYSVFFTSWHAIMDITLDNGVWNAVHIADVYRGRGSWGTTNVVTQDMSPQVSRSDDGSKIFFAWSDADSALTVTAANQAPNLYTRSYNVATRQWTAKEARTNCTADNGKILFPRLSANVLGTTGTYKLPVAYAKLGLNDDPLNVASFHFLDSLFVSDSDFNIPQCSIPVSISPTDTVVGCGSVVLDAGLGGQLYRWSTGAVTSTITVTTSGSYWVGKNQGCCTGGDTVYVVIEPAPIAAYNSSVSNLAANFSDQSSGNNTSWFWDFGDGNTSTTQNPNHTYSSAGTYTVCLTVTSACGSDSTCTSVTVNCPPATAAWNSSNSGLTVNFTDNTVGSGLSYSWAFGDGNISSAQNPSHTYSLAGSYTACLAITDSCGSDTLCQVITVCELPIAAYSFTTNLGQVDFTDGSGTGITGWVWDFGDGNTSTQQNPQHTYTVSGTYTACLTVTDACGSDTICDTINVNVIAIDDLHEVSVTTFPNPVQNVLGVRVLGLPAGQLQLRLRNVLGQSIRETSLLHTGNALEMQIDMQDLASGMYFVELETQGQRYIQKVLRD